ncbi:TonB family protein [Tardiphaga sp. 768_D3_N2_1]|uniref:TonB family protein n=1 Tax=Tardiphaga sp. 768_D3_N2_1 TaxID=3240783 RepID=UPI003F8924F1
MAETIASNVVTGEADRRPTVAATPSWTETVNSTDIISDADIHAWNGVIRILSDNQILLTADETQNYHRRVSRIISRAGAEHAAHFTLEFDAHFETVQIHSLKIVRDGQEIEHANADSIQLLRREKNFDRLIFDGRLTASFLIPDVREGDIVDVSFTIRNENPILCSRWSGWFEFDPYFPWATTHFRLLSPPTTGIKLRAFNAAPQPTERTLDSNKEWIWTWSARARVYPEDLCVPWQILHPCVQLSEIPSWGDIAEFLSGYYQDTKIPNEIKDEVCRIAETFRTPGDQATAWLRFVQKNLRYSAAAMINGGVIPRPLQTILASRFGDCKDATRFYLAGARELGLDVCAALVSTTNGLGLNDILPSLGAFDHCIVRLRVDGVSYWLDPTIPDQGGTLSSSYPPVTGWGLPLSKEARGLERIADRPAPHILHTEDKLEVGPRFGSPAVWTRDIEFSNLFADRIRHLAASSGSAALSRFMLEDAKRHWGNVSEVLPLQLEDEPERNAVRITALYKVNDLWIRNGEGGDISLKVPDFRFLDEIAPLRATHGRKSDIYLGRPRKLTQRFEIVLPKDWHWNNFQFSKELSCLSYSVRAVLEGRRSLIISRSLSVDSASLTAAECSDYGELTDVIGRNVIQIAAKERRDVIKPLKSSLWWLLPRKASVIVTAVVLIAIIRGAVSFFAQQQQSNSSQTHRLINSTPANKFSYEKEVWQRISSVLVYPERDTNDCTTRTTIVQFELNDSGNVTSAMVRQSSGDTSVDRAAMQAIYHAQAYPRRPQGVDNTPLLVPLTFVPKPGFSCSQ